MCHHYSGCGVCQHCRVGWSQMCDDGPPAVFGVTRDGAPHPLYESARPTPPWYRYLTSCRSRPARLFPAAPGTAYGALARLGLRGTETIAVFGQGPVGLAATQLAVAMGARAVAVDISPERLARAKQFGAYAVIDPRADDPVQALRDLSQGGVHCAIDCSSAPEARAQAIKSARKWGRVAMVG